MEVSEMINFEDPWPENEMEDWNDGEQQPMKKKNKNKRYMEAFGEYEGGYGNGGRRFHPYGARPPFFGPPMMMGGPPRPPPPYFMMGRGYGPGGPPGPRGPPMGPTLQQRVVNYLTRCGMAKDHLKNLPRQLLDLIKPEYCGICDMEFESYAISRVHYGSKNHLKNHKKWLSQFGQNRWVANPSAALEVPIKSRDLYCELCDVHITSKVHADSHYSGKQHKSIVEGRRGPKNPFLLQPEMRQRLDQLIRRERKHVKSMDSALTAEKHALDMKNVPPELYCDICKTSVTNTEQMTMHMNGKRHLTKEKQYILKKMKGEVTEDDGSDADLPDLTEENDQTTKISRKDVLLKPWITKNLLKCIKRRDALHMKQKKYPTNNDLAAEYKKYRNMCGESTKALKALYFGNQIINNINDPHECWQLLTEYAGKSSLDTEQTEMDKIISKLVNNYPDESQFTKFNEFFKEKNEGQQTTDPIFSLVGVNSDFKQIISVLRTGSSIAEDDISLAIKDQPEDQEGGQSPAIGNGQPGEKQQPEDWPVEGDNWEEKGEPWAE